ncbi:hypothetical protein DFH09DRAFT_1430746 [Mycena vulgaris]|nr:hypothetical protein DFH09DRAFT_1430746 [Mycena vulgaris]
MSALDTADEPAARTAAHQADQDAEAARAAADAVAHPLTFSRLAELADARDYPNGLLLALRRAWRRYHERPEGSAGTLDHNAINRVLRCSTFGEVASILEAEWSATDAEVVNCRRFWRAASARGDVPDPDPNGMQTAFQSMIIKKFYIDGNSIGGTGAALALSALLRDATSLHTADLSNIFTGQNDIIPQALGTLCSALKDLPALVDLDLGGNAVGALAVDVLLPILSENRALRVLRLNNTGLGPTAGARVADALQRNVRGGGLRVVLCGRSHLKDSSARAFAAHTHLVAVYLPQNGLREAGVEALVRALRDHCAGLRYLELGQLLPFFLSFMLLSHSVNAGRIVQGVTVLPRFYLVHFRGPQELVWLHLKELHTRFHRFIKQSRGEDTEKLERKRIRR